MKLIPGGQSCLAMTLVHGNTDGFPLQFLILGSGQVQVNSCVADCMCVLGHIEVDRDRATRSTKSTTYRSQRLSHMHDIKYATKQCLVGVFVPAS